MDAPLVPDEAEQAAIARIGELRAQGMSLRQIAVQLDEEGIKPQRGGRWHPQTLARLLR